jgi:autotransporter-associated beta strand protein
MIRMSMKSRLLGWLALAAASLALAADAQTLAITNGVQKYATLSGYTVAMTGKCELWVTNSVTPLSSCVINLNSVDAWLFLPNIKPSVVASTYLSQVSVSGAAAVADSNVRVVQYGQNGAVVIPQAASFQPLTVFTGNEFTGTATPYSQWTYYTGTGITNISSFKLKRGYQVVFAQSASGANYSKCYVAQDGDLEVGTLPPTLSQQVQFIYVTPWRWTSKKGIAGNPGNSLLNVNWWYDWSIDQSSSRDLEYVAIRQDRWWPSLSQNWQSLGINTVLGYNEPDSAVQANIAVGDAIWSWPDVLGTGLRAGAPAVSDGGWAWITNFMTQADATGLRVDFVPLHYYWCWDPTDPVGAATQMYNFLLARYNQFQRPLWVTEWNQGATWTTCTTPTAAQEQAAISAMINMLESTPFVERYALYDWLGNTRMLIDTNGNITPAGTTYSNLVSGLSYTQAMPDNGTRGIAEYLFATNLWDTSGYYNNAMAVGAPAFVSGHNSQVSAIALDGTNSYLQLPANMARGSGFTFAAWVYWNGGRTWQRIFDFGSDTSHYFFLTPDSGSGTLCFAITNGASGQIVQRSGAMTFGSWQHVAFTLNGGTATIYVNGIAVATATGFTSSPASFSPIRNFLGKSQFSTDPLFNGKLDEVEIADFGMTAAQIAVLYNGTQNPSFISGVWTNNASGNWGASSNWTGGAIANGISRMADFSAIDITANRTVTVDSPRTIGGLRFGNLAGGQTWTLAGTSTLTLDGGAPNAPIIAVNQNSATISAPLAATNGLVKNGGGTLILNGTETLGGGLTVNAGTVAVSGGTTVFGGGTSSIGYLTGFGNLALTGGSVAMGGELRVGGSDQTGTAYVATGAVTVAYASLAVGSLTVARGNYVNNTMSGTVTLNSGGTLISSNDVVIEYAGMGRGKLALNGGSLIVGPTATKWLMVGYYDSGAGELDITNGNLFLDNNTSIKLCRSGNTGTNTVNQAGGAVTFYSDAGATIGGGGNLDLNYAGGTNSCNIYNLKGGTLTVPQITSSLAGATRIFNFSGGTLKAAAASPNFFNIGADSAATVNVRNSGANINDGGFSITIPQALLHSTISGDSAKDGGLSKSGAGTLKLTGTNTYTGLTTVYAGTLALGGTGSISNSAGIVLSGSVLDVSAVPGGFALGAAQTLSGNGAVNGTIVNNGRISPGPFSGMIGTLILSNSPALNGVVLMDIDRNGGAPVNDQLNLPVSGLTYGGTLTVNNVGSSLQAGDVFQLFTATNYGGAFAVTNLPSLDPGLAWSNSLAVNGSVAVISTVSTVATNITWGVSGANLTLSWPTDHTGWRLQAQTNALSGGLGTNWADVSGANQTNNVIVPMDPTMGSVFYRLVYP